MSQDPFHAFWALLRWEGEIRNGRLQHLLSHTSVHVSRLIGSFRTANPGLLENDPVGKRWVPRGTVQLPDIDIDDYLAILREHGDTSDNYLVDARPRLQEPSAQLFSLIRRACLDGTGLQIRYASRSQPKGVSRVIYPKVIIRLSQRWHVRAWCAQREDYRDFNFGRIHDLVPVHGPTAALPPDTIWNTKVSLRLTPHRALPEEMRQVLRLEYMPLGAVRRIDTRAALTQYLINDIGAAVDPDKETPPRFLLEVVNRNEIAPYLFDPTNEK